MCDFGNTDGCSSTKKRLYFATFGKFGQLTSLLLTNRRIYFVAVDLKNFRRVFRYSPNILKTSSEIWWKQMFSAEKQVICFLVWIWKQATLNTFHQT